MTKLATLCVSLLSGLCLLLTGCLPDSAGQVDQEKDPHYQRGKSRTASMDFKGAIQSFEKALQVNPNSGSAHLELGLLYEDHEKDFATAIYHYQRHLKLRPDSNMADLIRQRIQACRIELAKTVSFALIDEQMQREMDRITANNRTLKEEVQHLQQQLSDTREALRKASSPPAPQPATKPEPAPRFSPGPDPYPTAASLQQQRPSSRVTAPRTHTVRSGDTLYGIARQYGVDTSALRRSNPTVNPSRLQIGHTLTIPPRP